MRPYWRAIWKGLLAVLPLVITFYVIFRIVAFVEFLVGGLLKVVLPEALYVPGMGIVGALVLLYLIGVTLERVEVVQKLSGIGVRVLERIPFIKTLYGGLRDILRYFSMAREGEKSGRRVALISLGENIRLMGFTTGEATEQVGLSGHEEGTVSVYLPMSYQIGGFTVYVPRSQVQTIDMSVEDAMQMALSAGMVKKTGKQT